MGTHKARALVVDDFGPFRQLLTSILQNVPAVQVIGEASDGLDAVRKAEELKPELILLDVGLPTLTGIEAARRILRRLPTCKILFVTEESSLDVVQEAFALGASAYLVKSAVRRELLAALSAVLRDEKFVGSRFAGRDFFGVAETHAAESIRHYQAFSQSKTPNSATVSNHRAEFYSDDSSFLDGFTQFIGAAIKAGSSVILIATEAHREGLLPRLQAHGVDIGSAVEQDRYVALDVGEALSRFMVNGLPDRIKFLRVVDDLIVTAAKAAKGAPARVVACGEGAPLLLAQGEAEAAIQLERLWGEIGKARDVDILCGYPLGIFHGVENSFNLHRVCSAHSGVYVR